MTIETIDKRQTRTLQLVGLSSKTAPCVMKWGHYYKLSKLYKIVTAKCEHISCAVVCMCWLSI